MHVNYLPLFLEMTGKKFLVFGAGKIAARRTEVLLHFGASITIVSPEISEEMQAVIDRFEAEKEPDAQGRVCEIVKAAYKPGSVREDMDYVLAVTNDDKVNEGIFRECRHREIPVNVASDQTKCDFYFPAVVETEDVIIGLTSGGRNHEKVRQMAQQIREMFA